jgi:hypothetical protein
MNLLTKSRLTHLLNSLADLLNTFALKNESLPADKCFDDVIYLGSNAEIVEMLFSKVAANGLFNIVLCGGKFNRKVSTQVGRVHYGNIRIVGTTGSDPAEAMANIPATARNQKRQ